jgi:hypothetical protein
VKVSKPSCCGARRRPGHSGRCYGKGGWHTWHRLMKPKLDPRGIRRLHDDRQCGQSTLTLAARRGTIRERFLYRRPTARWIATAAVILPSLQEYRLTLAIVRRHY